MSLARLRADLAQAGVKLTLTPEGRLRYDAPGPVPLALVEGARRHRASLLRQVEAGRDTSGRLDVQALQLLPGRCGCCRRWIGPDEYGDGLCTLGRAAHGWLDGNPTAPVLTTPHHECGARSGRGWQAK